MNGAELLVDIALRHGASVECPCQEKQARRQHAECAPHGGLLSCLRQSSSSVCLPAPAIATAIARPIRRLTLSGDANPSVRARSPLHTKCDMAHGAGRRGVKCLKLPKPVAAARLGSLASTRAAEAHPLWPPCRE